MNGEIENALITNVSLTMADNGCITYWLMLLIRKRKCPKCGAMVVQFNLFRTPIVIKNCSNCGAKMDEKEG